MFWFRVKAVKPETQLRECLFRENSDSVLNLGVISELLAMTSELGVTLKSAAQVMAITSGIFLGLLESWRWNH
jgi:hypothetical protein